MTKQDFMSLTGENPEDMFGNDWENEVEELGLNYEDIKNRDL